MPIYEYHCGQCQHDFEVLIRSPQDERGIQCPECRNPDVNRRLSVFAARQGESAPGVGAPKCAQCEAGNGLCPYQT